MSRRRAKPSREQPLTQHVGRRSLGGWRAAAILLAVAGVAWVGSDALVRRAQAARLPVPPDPSTVPLAVQRDIVDADAAARANPTSAALVGDLGVVYHASLLNAHAQQAYARAEQLAPSDWRWTYYRGLLHDERGEHDAAYEAFARVAATDTTHGLAWFRLAEIAFKQGRSDVAEQAYLKALAAPALRNTIAAAPPRVTTPLAAYAEFGLARLALERNRPDEAGARLAALVKTNPRFGPAQTLLLHLPETVDGSEEGVALRDSSRAYVPVTDPLLDDIVRRSLHTDLLLKHAALAARGGDRAWREFLARRALTANPRGLDVLLEMASMLQASGRHTDALEYLRQCEEVAPGDHHTLVEQGRSLAELDRLDEAEQVLRRAVRVRDAAAEYNLGTVLDRKERWEEARTHYERALAIDPFHARAMNNLAVGFDRHGQTTMALALYARALEAAPTNAETYSNLGSALIQQRRFAEAIRALESAITLDPDAPDAHNNLGIALAQSGRFADAMAEFEAALRLSPAHLNARRNLEQLAARRRSRR